MPFVWKSRSSATRNEGRKPSPPDVERLLIAPAYSHNMDILTDMVDNQALTVYELDRPEMIADRWKRIARTGLEPACHVEDIGCDLSQPSWKEKLIHAGFDPKKTSFGTLLGISYYLSRQDFKNLVAVIASISCERSSICFDYPVSEAGAESQRNRELAAAAGERMKAKYSYEEMEALLSNAGFLIYEHMDAGEATDAFLKESGMTAPAGVGYCLAVRKG